MTSGKPILGEANTHRSREIWEESPSWHETAARLVSWLGIVGLMAVIAQSAWAAPAPGGASSPPPGMPSGSRPITNPFTGGVTNEGGAAFADEAEEGVEFPEEAAQPAARPGGGGAARAGGAPAPGAGAAPRTFSAGGTPPDTNPLPRTQKGIQVGGGAASGVVEHRDLDPLFVNTESGEGSRDMVTDFNFPDADIMDIAKTLGKLTGKNFLLDKDVKGRITIISNGAITVGDAWKAFLTALDMNGFALIPSGKFIRIARTRDARDKQLKTYVGDYSPDTDALITRVFPLKYLSSEEVARNFRSFMPANSRIIPYEQTNTVIVTDTGSNISKLQKLLEILDVEGYDAGIEVVPVKYASAIELAKLIDQLVPGTTAAPGTAGGTRFNRGGGAFAARRTKEGGIINTIIADERTNNLIVHANSKGADQVRELVAKLDHRLPTSQGGGKVHVVYLQFADAEAVANTLNNLSSQGGAAAAPKPGGGTGVNPVKASLFEGSIRIAADKSTNSLVITASQADFETVRRVINKLDMPRDQVYAEVIIMEVNVGRQFEFSANLLSPATGLALAPAGVSALAPLVTQDFSSLKGFSLGFQAGTDRTVRINNTDFTVKDVLGLVKAIQTTGTGNILATPQILTLDNTEAEFESAEKIPVPTVTAVQGAVSTGFTKESVSLSIKIKPSINKLSNFVKLNIKTKLADISTRQLPANVVGNALATFERNASTEVVVADKDTVVLGGLTREKVQDTTSKVPILGDIPLLGWLFRSKTSEVEKVNLLVFITPQIIRQYESIREVLDRKLRERDEFIEFAAGGDDKHKNYRDRLIRGLPNLAETLKNKPETATSIGSAETEAAEEDGESVGSISSSKSSDEPSPEAVRPPEPRDPGVPPPADAQPFEGGIHPGAIPVEAN
jgi:general secretion pathway protein D